jgi:hypothetical protein
MHLVTELDFWLKIKNKTAMNEKELQEIINKENTERVMQECYEMCGIW